MEKTLKSSMFDPPVQADWETGSYKRTAASEPGESFSIVKNWMARLLRIPDTEAEAFAQANRNESRLVSGNMHCVMDPKTNLTWLYSSVGEKVCYLAGRYNIESVEQLQARNPHAAKTRGVPQTKLIFVTGLHEFTDPNFDVRSLQANPRNCGATFQVASNFNGLEYMSAAENRSMGVARYVRDRTQGPSASESCGPATLYRTYFVDGNEHHHHSRRYTHDETAMSKEVNTLDHEKIRHLLPVTNGYVTFRKPQDQMDLSILDSDAWKYVKIVRHDFAQVTYGLRHPVGGVGEVMDVCTDPNQIVNQIFNAGINWVDMSDYVQDRETQKKFALFLSKASMIRSILAAQENRKALASVPSAVGRNRLFLNLVGCGVFRNDRKWLMEAWSSPEVFPYIQNSGLEIVICFGAGNDYSPDETSEALEFVQKARDGGIPGFSDVKLAVEIVDAADSEAMSRVFGRIHDSHSESTESSSEDDDEQDPSQHQHERHPPSIIDDHVPGSGDHECSKKSSNHSCWNCWGLCDS